MYAIDKKIDDVFGRNNKSSLMLKPNKTLHPNTISYPIVWSGFVGNTKVTIIQNNDNSSSMDSYDFSGLPININYLQGQIMEAIDQHLRIMD